MEKLQDYAYDLPRELVAQSPLERRDASRLLVLPPDGPPVHGEFPQIVDHLRSGDVLVVNDTKVVPARLACRRPSGARVDLLLLGSVDGNGAFHAMLKSNRKLRQGERLLAGERGAEIVLVEKGERGAWTIGIEGQEVGELLETAGRAPLPPYIHRDIASDDRDSQDLDRYQTLFAKNPGAVAAPTAGLHFSESVFAALEDLGVETARVTLHVGPGTFLPVRSEDIAEHRMLGERYVIEQSEVERIHAARERGSRVVAVGTTTCRVLESVKPSHRDPQAYEGETDLFIRPGHVFEEIDALVTNFHMPESTLLMLVAAFAGRERILGAYREAIDRGYRFFSYGDAMLLFPTEGARS